MWFLFVLLFFGAFPFVCVHNFYLALWPYKSSLLGFMCMFPFTFSKCRWRKWSPPAQGGLTQARNSLITRSRHWSWVLRDCWNVSNCSSATQWENRSLHFGTLEPRSALLFFFLIIYGNSVQFTEISEMGLGIGKPIVGANGGPHKATSWRRQQLSLPWRK